MLRYPSAFPWGKGDHEVVDEGNLYNQAKWENLQTLRIMKSCLRHDEIIKLTFYNEIFRYAEFVLCADEIPPAAPFGFDRLRMTRRVTASFSSGGVNPSPTMYQFLFNQNLWDDGLILF